MVNNSKVYEYQNCHFRHVILTLTSENLNFNN